MLTPEQCRSHYGAWLKEAMDAYHALNTGTSARVVVDQNGERVEYTAANRQSLWAYIVKLQAAVHSSDPYGTYMGRPSGPAGFTF